MMAISHVFFDVGGVLGTGGWDAGQRARAVERFGLDPADFELRHAEADEMWEDGRLTLEQYLHGTVFTEPRSFSRREFTAFMLSQSEPLPETIAIARALALAGRQRLMTINNESAELNTYRLRRFGLTDIFDAFFSSCWLGAMKPSPRIFEPALSLSQADPARSVFIDDLERNLAPARALGMHTIRFRSAGQLASELGDLEIGIRERGRQLCDSR
jgi:putative hydrolase of the HAD superfamily